MLTWTRLSRWCYPGPRGVHGRPDPIHHPERQGPGTIFSHGWDRPKKKDNVADSCWQVREDDILCLLESEREARRLR